MALALHTHAGMGKRKIKFDQRKNCERLHKNQLQQCKSMPQPSLVVKVALRAYISADVSSLNHLHDRLQKSQMLPRKWKMARIATDTEICDISLSHYLLMAVDYL